MKRLWFSFEKAFAKAYWGNFIVPFVLGGAVVAGFVTYLLHVHPFVVFIVSMVGLVLGLSVWGILAVCQGRLRDKLKARMKPA